MTATGPISLIPTTVRHRHRRESFVPTRIDRAVAQVVRRPSWRPGYLVVSGRAAIIVTAVMVACAVSGWATALLQH